MFKNEKSSVQLSVNVFRNIQQLPDEDFVKSADGSMTIGCYLPQKIFVNHFPLLLVLTILSPNDWLVISFCHCPVYTNQGEMFINDSDELRDAVLKALKTHGIKPRIKREPQNRRRQNDVSDCSSFILARTHTFNLPRNNPWIFDSKMKVPT